jgi:microcystin-dependent protein
MVLRNVAKTFSLEEQRQEINLIAQDLHDLATNYVSVESDPIFTASVAAGISSTDVTNWNTAYSWGDHAQAGYLTTASLSGNVANWDTAYSWGDHSQAGYLTSETDPVFAASDAAAVTAAKISNWDNAYSWGDHSLSGYATQTFVNTALTNLNNWDTAYGWGDHSAAGYITNISSFSIGDLSDVDVTTSTPQNQETLFWSGTNWVPGPIPQTGIEYTDLSVVVASTPFGNGNLTYNDNLGEFTFTPPVTFSGSYNDLSNTPNIPSQLNDLSDVIVAGTINNNDVISWDGAHWTPTPLSSLGGGIALTNLSVTVNSPGNPNLSYNNTTGVFSYTPPDLSAYLTSVAINLSEISDVNISGTPSDGAVLKYNTSNSQWELGTDTSLSLTALSTVTNPASGTGALGYNNTTGVFSYTPPVLPTELSDFFDVNISGTPTNGAVLKYNSSTNKWELGTDLVGDAATGEPVGTISAWGGGASSIPSGWLLCDGSNVSRTTYADLYAALGDLHGAGDGSATFGLPDLRNRFIVGAYRDQDTGQTFDPSTGDVTGYYNPGNIGGTVAHQLTELEMPSHTHTEVGWSFQHTAANPGPGGAGTSSNNTSGSAGSDNYHENRPPWFALCWIVKAEPGATSSGGSNPGSGGSIDLTAFSVNVATAGTANLSYNNLTGVFTYTPPDLSGYSTFSGSYNDLTDKPTIPQSLNDLLDVVISGTPADGAVIKYNSSNSRWELGSDTGGTASSGSGSLPMGSIIMWSGDTSSIPTGWQLCDGTNGTPDLRNRFVMGAGDTYPVGNTGGNADSVVVEHSHTINDHNHTFSGSGSDNVDISISGTTGNQSQSHNHSFTTNTTGDHNHSGTVPTPLYVPGGDTDRGTDSSIFSVDNSQTQFTNTTGNHNHSGTTGGQSDDHNHSFSGTGSDTVNISVSGTTGVQSDSGTSTAGSSGTGTNIPPYYALCFIYCVTPGGGTTTGATDLDDLTDVVITSPTAGQVLKYNGTNWVNDTDATSSGGSGIALTDLSVTTNSVGTAALSYDNTTGVFSYTPPQLTVSSLTDVSYSVIENGWALTYQNGTWTASGIPSELGQLSNVSATAPNDGDVLTWNASLSTWQPAAASGGASGSGTTHQWADGVEASGWSASDLSDYMFNGNLSLFAKAETSGTDYLGWDNSANGANLPVLNGPVEIFIRYADVGNFTYEVNGVTVTPDLTGVDTNGDWITLTSGTAGSFRVTAPSTSSNIQIAGVKSNGLLLTPTALYGGSSGGGSTFNLDANLNTTTASAGEILSWNGTDYEWVADQTGSGASAFTSLTDTPSTLTADKWIKVNSAGDGIEFVDAPSGGSGSGSSDPAGTVVSWAGAATSLPTGYLLCDGSAISRTAYSDLFAVIGTTHGSGDGSTTFNLPNLVERFVLGADGSDPTVASTGGTSDAILVSHSHTINNHTHSFSGSGSDTVNISVSGTTGNQSANHTHVFSTDTQGNHNHQWGTDDNQGAGGGTNNPDANGGQAWKGTTSTNGAHSHSGTTSGVSNNHNHTFSGSGSDNVSISVSGTTGNPSNTGTNAQGSSATGANMPPYYALCYIIKSTAGSTSSGGGSSYTDSDVNDHLNTSSASSGQILSWDGSDFVWVDDQTGGSGNSSGGIGFENLPSQSASGSEVTFAGIPADAKEITVMFEMVGVTNTSQHLLVQLGTPSGWIATGYYASSEAENGTYDISSSSGFPIHNRNTATSNGNRFTGSMIINLMPTGSSNSYTQIGQFHRWTSDNDGTDVGSSCQSFGVVSGIDNSLTITRVRILANHAGGSQTFTTGIFGVSYKGSGSSGSGTGVTDGDKGDITVTSSGSTWTIDDGVISTAKIATGAVNSGKLATNSVTTTAIETGAVTIDKISASGTPDATTFLRGDGNWVIPPSSSSGIALTDLSVVVNSPGNANFTYSNSTGVFTYTPPDLSGYSTFSGSYNDLSDKPTLFSGSYDDLTNKPVLFSGSYNDLSNKPVVPSGLDDLNDVNVGSGSPSNGDVLTWSSSNGAWVNQQPSGGGGSSSSSSGGGGITLLPAQTINSAAQATSVEFSNIPSDALEITVMFEGASLSGTDDFEIQLGTASGYIVSNYESLSQNEGGADKLNSTSSFILRSDNAGRIRTGSMLIKKASDTSYVQTGQFAISPSSSEGGNQTYGSLSSVSGTVNKLRIKSSGSNHFDAGSISVSYKTASSGSSSGGGTTTAPADDSPVGVISMWAGSTSSIPDGWQLCDGGSAATSELQSVVGSTVPDLRDKFIVGAGNSYSVGSTGGSADSILVEHAHAGGEHSHGINTSFNISASGTTSTDDVPHTHPIAGTVGTGSGLNAGADYTGNYSPRSTNAATDTNHSHTFSINTIASLSGSTQNGGTESTTTTGESGTGKNIPPYYSLCYIIKNDASLYLKSPNGTSFRLSVDNSGNVSATSV